MPNFRLLLPDTYARDARHVDVLLVLRRLRKPSAIEIVRKRHAGVRGLFRDGNQRALAPSGITSPHLARKSE